MSKEKYNSLLLKKSIYATLLLYLSIGFPFLLLFPLLSSPTSNLVIQWLLPKHFLPLLFSHFCNTLSHYSRHPFQKFFKFGHQLKESKNLWWPNNSIHPSSSRTNKMILNIPFKFKMDILCGVSPKIKIKIKRKHKLLNKL